ncbi:hypothetical protein NAV11_07070 [Pseudomonas songnenensis]|uniref:ABC transporter ATP-binding protein n=1 Tax=Pseudomonas songnenensis TaxID=1176259 RepID=A0ABX9UXZ6_9PSED|nr:hypothetical protein [Pseudomonas songnenensis]MCQ4299672.1 hypothetical protein [Pseudomonas songnenensis]RMH98287.1 hypothetical protein EA798_07740 [Pseudomonas songnenensis]
MKRGLLATQKSRIMFALKLLRASPGFSLGSIVVTLVSQVSMIISGVLPLKVIILIGSESIPSYFPSYISLFDRSQLIMFLVMLSVAFFVIHQLCEILNTRILTKGGAVAMARLPRNEKLTGLRFHKTYSMFARGLSDTFFVLIATVVLGIINFRLVAFSLVYIFTVSTFVAFKAFQGTRILHKGGFISVVNLFGVFGFLSSFVFLVSDLLRGGQGSVFFAIIAIIILRQIFRKIPRVINNFRGPRFGRDELQVWQN